MNTFNYSQLPPPPSLHLFDLSCTIGIFYILLSLPKLSGGQIAGEDWQRVASCTIETRPFAFLHKEKEMMIHLL